MDSFLTGDVVSDPRNSGEFNKNRENGRKPTPLKTETRNWKVQKPEPKRNQEAALMKPAPPRPNRPPVDQSGPGRPKATSIESANGRSKPSFKPNENKFQQKSENRPIQKKPMPPQHEVCVNFKHFSI